MKTHLLTILFVTLGLVTGGCATRQTGQPEDNATSLSTGSFMVQWKADLELKDQQIKSIHLLDKWVLAYTTQNHVYVLDRNSGRVISVRDVTEPAAELYPPVLLKEWVVFPTTGTIEVYDLTWKKLRSFALPFALRSGAAGSGTRVYAGADYSRGGRVAAFDVRQRPYTSRPDWELMTFGGISSSPACWQENIYAGSRDGKVYAMRAEDRASIWHMMPGGVFDTGASIAADLKVDNEGLYVATMNSILFCLDPVSGRVRWQYYSGHALPEAPVLTLGTVYLGVPDKGLVAIDKGPGPIRPEKWVAADAVKYLGEDSQDVFAVGQGGKILALDRSTGSVKFSSSSSYSAFTPNPGQSVVFVATDGKVFAIVPVRTPGQAGQLAMAQ